MSRLKELDYFRTPTYLFKHIESQDDAKALSILQSNPEEASIWILRRSLSPINCDEILWKRLPIHEACLRNCSDQLMDALIQAFPMGLQSADAAGRLPLHHACIHGANEQVILKMIMGYPEGLTMKDSWDKTPSDVLETSTHPNKAIVAPMLNKGPGFYFRKVAEDDWAEVKKVEDQKVEEEKKLLKVKHAEKLEILERSFQEDRMKFQEKEQLQRKELADLISGRDQMKAERDQMRAERDAMKLKYEEWNEKVKASNSALKDLRENINLTHSEHAKTVKEMNEAFMQKEEQTKKDAREIVQLKEKLESTQKTLVDTKAKMKLLQESQDDLSRQSSRVDDDDLSRSTSTFTESMCVRVASLTSENKRLKAKNVMLQDKLNEVDGLSQVLMRITSSIQALDMNEDGLLRRMEEQKSDLEHIHQKYGNSHESLSLRNLQEDLNALRNEFSVP